jgi:regulator of replication initiation timing
MDYQKLYEGLATRVPQLESQVRMLVQENDILKMEKKQWVAEKEQQTAIIQQTLAGVNSQTQDILEENGRLKEEIAQLKG